MLKIQYAYSANIFQPSNKDFFTSFINKVVGIKFVEIRANIALILYKYCANIAQIFCKFCKDIVQMFPNIMKKLL